MHYTYLDSSLFSRYSRLASVNIPEHISAILLVEKKFGGQSRHPQNNKDMYYKMKMFKPRTRCGDARLLVFTKAVRPLKWVNTIHDSAIQMSTKY